MLGEDVGSRADFCSMQKLYSRHSWRSSCRQALMGSRRSSTGMLHTLNLAKTLKLGITAKKRPIGKKVRVMLGASRQQSNTVKPLWMGLRRASTNMFPLDKVID